MPLDWKRRLDAHVDSLFEQIRGIRRRLHQFPEPSGEEHGTAAYLERILSAAGLAVRVIPARNGLIAESASAPPGALRVALRADTDALRLHDAKTVEYRSQNDGVVHACGHDAHTAAMAGALLALHALEQEGALPWPAAWRGVFQPAEETAQGAVAMIAAGALENVSAIFGLHVDPSRDSGTVGVRDGALTAACDWLEVTIQGRGAHAARPHESEDPIAAAAQLISALYAFIPRSVDSQDPIVVTIGRVEAGYSANVIPGAVELQGTLRTLDPDVREAAKLRIEKLARGMAEASGVKIRVEFSGGPPAVFNDPGANRVLREAARGAAGPENVREIPRPSMGGEDFSEYVQRVPGAMFRLGVRGNGVGAHPLHSPFFDIDESALAVGSKILARAAILGCRPSEGDPEHGQDALPTERQAHARN